MSDYPPAIVIKLDSINGLQTSRTLAKYNIPVFGIADNKNHFCCWTNTCKKVVQADTTSFELIDALCSIGQELGEKAVIFSCSDDSMNLISAHREVLNKWFKFILPEHDTIELFMDKVKFYKFALSNNLPIPATFFPKTRSEIESISDKINYPCIIKPPRATTEWWSKFDTKLLRVSNKSELIDSYDKCQAATKEPIVQEWIEGDDSHLNSCTYYYNKNHEPVITFASQKLRQWPIENGEISLGKEIRNDKVVEHTTQMLKHVKFSGVGSLEMKKNPRDQKYYMIEANVCRLPLRFKIVEAAGVELIYTMYLEALGKSEKTNTTQTYRHTKWVSLRRDLMASRAYMKKGSLTFRDWLISMRGVNTFAVLSLRDPLPFLLDIPPIRRALSLLNRMIRSPLEQFLRLFRKSRY